MAIEPVHNNDPFSLTQAEILDCFNVTPVGDGRGGYLVAVGRAIEAKVLEKRGIVVEEQA